MPKNAFTAGPNDVSLRGLWLDPEEWAFIRALCESHVEENTLVPAGFGGNIAALQILEQMGRSKPIFVDRDGFAQHLRGGEHVPQAPAGSPEGMGNTPS